MTVSVSLDRSVECAVVPWPPLCFPNGCLIERGQEVRCQRLTPPRGTWRRYDGKVGTVEVLVPTITESGQSIWVGEIGVDLGDRAGVVWFRPDELVPTTAVTGSQRRLSGPRTEDSDTDRPKGLRLLTDELVATSPGKTNRGRTDESLA